MNMQEDFSDNNKIKKDKKIKKKKVDNTNDKIKYKEWLDRMQSLHEKLNSDPKSLSLEELIELKLGEK